MPDSEILRKEHSVNDAAGFSLNDVILEYDLDMKVIDVNPAFAKCFGFSPIHLYAKDLQIIFDLRTLQGDEVDYDSIPAVKALSGEKIKQERYSIYFRKKNYEISCNSFPVYNSKQISGAISIWHQVVNIEESTTKRKTILADSYLSTFESLENILLSSKNYGTIAQQVLEMVVQASKCDSAMVSYLQDDYYEVKNICGINENIRGLRISKSRETYANLALKHKEIQLVEETGTHPHVLSERILNTGIRSFIVIPLISKHKKIGVIFLHYYEKTKFTHELKEFLNHFSSLLSLTLENNELFENYQNELSIKEEKERKLIRLNNLLTALSHSSAAMVQAKSEFEFIKHVCNIIVGKSNQALAWVGFVGKNSLRPEIWAGPANHYINEILHDKLNSCDEPSKQVIFSHKPSVYNDISKLEKQKSGAHKAVEYNLYSRILLPLIFQNEVFGVLCIYSFEKNAYSEDEIVLYTELAKHLSHGIMTFRTETARKETELRLIESIEKFEFLTHKSNALICEIDFQGIIVYENEKFQQIFSSDQILMKQFSKIIIQRLKANANVQEEFSIIDMGGYERWFRCYNNTFINKKGHTHYSLILFDISQTKETEYQLRQYAEELKSLNATKDKFFSIIAHDLKNPFTCLIGASELLTMESKKLEMDTVKKLGSILYETSIKGFALLQNLLDWARSQTGSIGYHPERIDLNELIEKCKEDVFASIIAKKICIKYCKYKNMYLWADRNMIRTVIRNLLSNAVKYSYVGGIVAISAIKNQFGITIKIEDHGNGISEENIQKLFRIDTNFINKGTLKEEGTGLGLILCKEFVEKNNGKIKVESIYGKGCIFSVNLPISR